MKALGHFPSLMVWGSAGSGKDHHHPGGVLAIVWHRCQRALQCHGNRSSRPYCSFHPPTRSLPLWMSTSLQIWPGESSTLCTVCFGGYYGGEVEERGTRNLGTRAYRLLTPICLAGEARPDESALADRMVSVTPNRNTLTRGSVYVETFKRFAATGLKSFCRALYPVLPGGGMWITDIKASKEIIDDVFKPHSQWHGSPRCGAGIICRWWC